MVWYQIESGHEQVVGVPGAHLGGAAGLRVVHDKPLYEVVGSHAVVPQAQMDRRRHEEVGPHDIGVIRHVRRKLQP